MFEYVNVLTTTNEKGEVYPKYFFFIKKSRKHQKNRKFIKIHFWLSG